MAKKAAPTASVLITKAADRAVRGREQHHGEHGVTPRERQRSRTIPQVVVDPHGVLQPGVVHVTRDAVVQERLCAVHANRQERHLVVSF
jgi:hypothetical protein